MTLILSGFLWSDRLEIRPSSYRILTVNTENEYKQSGSF